jgi:hypothetical protein
MKTPTSNIPTIGPLYADDLQSKFHPKETGEETCTIDFKRSDR